VTCPPDLQPVEEDETREDQPSDGGNVISLADLKKK